MAPGLTVGDGDHPTTYLSSHPFQYKGTDFSFDPAYDAFETETRPPKLRGLPRIGNDVWIGANATITRGVTVGDGAVIAGGAFVNRDVPAYSIVGGVAAKHLKWRFDSAELRQRLCDLRWWDYTLKSLQGVRFENIGAAVEEIERRKAAGAMELFAPKRYQINGADAILLQVGT